MEFRPGQGVIFYDKERSMYKADVIDCFRQLRMSELINLKPGAMVWIYFPETPQFAGLEGFLHVTVEELVLDKGYLDNHLKWKAGHDLRGESPVYSSDFTKALVQKLRDRRRLHRLMAKHPELIWPKPTFAATP